MNVVGLGSAGCRIAQCLSKYGVYNIYQVDNIDDGYENFLPMKEQENHEDYEKNYEKLNLDIEGPATLILCGAGKITGATLRILQELRNSKVKILYIKPRTSDTSDIQKIRHKLVNQILQELTRSGLLEEFLIVDNERIEKIANPTIIDYWNPINQLIADTFHMVNVFRNTEPLLKSNNKVPNTSRITTFSLVNFEESSEEMFYDLQTPRAKSYYFALSENYIKENRNLLPDVREFISSRQEENCDYAYSIFQTAYDQNYAYGYHYATLIQEQDKNLFTSEEE